MLTGRLFTVHWGFARNHELEILSRTGPKTHVYDSITTILRVVTERMMARRRWNLCGVVWSEVGGRENRVT